MIITTIVLGVTVSLIIIGFLFNNKDEPKINVFIKINTNERQIIPFIKGSVYPPKLSQNKKYLKTASGRLVMNDDKIMDKHIISLSRDILFNYNLFWGDSIEVICSNQRLSGKYVVEDCMDSNVTKSCDFMISRNDLKLFPEGIYNVILKPINK